MTQKIKLFKEAKHMVLLFPKSSGAPLGRLIKKQNKTKPELKDSWVQNAFGNP